MLAYLFPGQGSQCRGMGSELFAPFSDYIKKADQLLGYSLQTLCMKDPQQQLNQTQFTQPALFAINALTYLKTVTETGKKPDYVAGHSLGEYSALFAAEVFDFETGLRLTQKRGELMSQAKNGSMAALLGSSKEEVSQLLKENQLTAVAVANYNSYKQLVISGPKADIEQAKTVFTQLNHISFIPLAVSGAFHSPCMADAQEEFGNFVQQIHFKTPCIPVIANINAQPYHPSVIKHNLIQQITHPVRWVDTIEYLHSKSLSEFKEIGPGTVLNGLMNRIQNKQ